jgi:hypothetical protein
MSHDLLALDPMTAMALERGRALTARELLEGFVEGDARCAEVLGRLDFDRLLAGVEATLCEKLDLQEEIYDRLDDMLDDRLTRDLAVRVLEGCGASRARQMLALRHRAA